MGQTESIYSQTKKTNAAVAALAPVLNSPFALGYATVNPAGWKFGDGRSYASMFGGFDVMAKYSSGHFYIFAMPRYSATTTNQTATFTIKNTGATTAIVIGENRSIPITNGVFSDTFANGNTVHIYRLD